MSKPLKDWTLGELKEYCSAHRTVCGWCPFRDDDKCILYHSYPEIWDLTVPLRFTLEEVERAKALKQFAPGVEEIIAETSFKLIAKNEREVIRMENDLFPSIKPGQTVKISEIIGECE